jgi:hypothetical protein
MPVHDLLLLNPSDSLMCYSMDLTQFLAISGESALKSKIRLFPFIDILNTSPFSSTLVPKWSKFIMPSACLSPYFLKYFNFLS